MSSWLENKIPWIAQIFFFYSNKHKTQTHSAKYYILLIHFVVFQSSNKNTKL